MAGDPERERRLAEALRANLRRRKAQQRGAPEEPEQNDHSPAVPRPDIDSA